MMNRRQALTLGMSALGSSILSAAPIKKAKAKRILFICNSLGFVHREFYPTKSGKNVSLPGHFERFAKLREQFTALNTLVYKAPCTPAKCVF